MYSFEGGRPLYTCIIFLTVFLRIVQSLNWLQVKIVWLDIHYECFKHSCSETKLRFVVKESSLEHSFCWPINFDGIVRPVDSYFVPSETWLNFTVEIAGQDPIYRFPRICDKSDLEELLISNSHTFVFPRGRCFNATVTLQRANDNLLDKSNSKLSNSTHNDYPLVSSYFLAGLSPVPIWVVFILAALNILLLISIVVLLYVSRQKKRKETMTEFELAVSRTASEETRYEMPWEQKYRPLPLYLKELQGKHPLSNDGASGAGVVNQSVIQ